MKRHQDAELGYQGFLLLMIATLTAVTVYRRRISDERMGKTGSTTEGTDPEQ